MQRQKLVDGKDFPSSNYPIYKNCVVHAYEKKNSAVQQKDKKIKLLRKMFKCFQRYCFEQYHTCNQST